MTTHYAQLTSAPVGGGIDTERASGFLDDRFGAAATSVELLRQGGWSTAFAFRRRDVEYVIRFSLHADDFERDRLAMRYASKTLPIPVVSEIGEAFGGYYAISRRVRGTFLNELDDEQMRATLPSLFAALDAMRVSTISDTSGYGGWNVDGAGSNESWASALLAAADDEPTSRCHGWRRWLEESDLGAASFDEAHDALRNLIHFAPEDRHLIHGDLLNFNVLVDDRKLAAVIDWGCSLYGDSLYDLAWLVFWSPWFPQWSGIDFLAESRSHFEKIRFEVPHFDERLRLSMIHIGLSDQAYQAYIGNSAHVESIAQRTLALAYGPTDNRP